MPAIDLSQVISLLAVALFGGLAGAVLTQWFVSRRAKEAGKRVLAAIRADVQRSRKIARHNVTTANFG